MCDCVVVRTHFVIVKAFNSMNSCCMLPICCCITPNCCCRFPTCCRTLPSSCRTLANCCRDSSRIACNSLKIALPPCTADKLTQWLSSRDKSACALVMTPKFGCGPNTSFMITIEPWVEAHVRNQMKKKKDVLICLWTSYCVCYCYEWMMDCWLRVVGDNELTSSSRGSYSPVRLSIKTFSSTKLEGFHLISRRAKRAAKKEKNAKSQRKTQFFEEKNMFWIINISKFSKTQ